MYLHEIIHVVPGQEELYMSSILAHSEGSRYLGPNPPPPGVRARELMLGHFRTAQVSGTWPKVVNLWWAQEWSERAAALKMQFAGGESAFLEEWWNRNLTLRRGGYDRILLPAPFSPGPEVAGQIRGRVFLHEIARVRFGEADAYLRAMGEQFVPVAERHGWRLAGAYRVALRPCDVLSIWAMPEWGTFASLLGDESDPALRSWAAYRDEALTDCDEMVMLPGRVSLLGLPPVASA
jgi:hypothetical protein